MEQFPGEGGSLLVLRVRGDPARDGRDGAAATAGGDAGPAVRHRRSRCRAMVDAQRRSWRVGATMFVAFGVLALVVAAVGLYGVIALQRRAADARAGRSRRARRAADVDHYVGGRPERAIRACRNRRGPRRGVGGGRWVQPLLFHESASDPAVYTAVAATMVVVAIVASASPAFRAASADPIKALKAE